MTCKLALNEIANGLTEYYQRYLKRGSPIISEVKEITKGWETKLISFKVELEEIGTPVSVDRVVRLYPGNYAAQKAEREFKMMYGLFHAGYPVPEVFHIEMSGRPLGNPFIIMERIRGRNMMEDLPTASEEELGPQIDVFVKLMIDLHNLDPSQLFPEDLDVRSTREYINRSITWARRNMEETGVGWLRPVLDWLDERKTGVSCERPSITHGDFHPDNIILREDRSPVVIDWGATRIGDYRADLAWTVLLASTYWSPDMRDIIIDAYGRLSGRSVSDIEFFEVMAIFRRMYDVSVSLVLGADERGMRPGAQEMMRQDSEHLHRVHDLLRERTGLVIREFEELLDTL